jgi:hypothetical protein
MCDVAAIGLGLQGVSIVGNFISDKQTANSYAEYQALSTQSTLSNYIQQSKAINNRYAEDKESSSYQQQQIYIQNLQAKATAEASAAGSGITGSTIETLFKGYDRATAVNNYVAARNLHIKGLQYTDELEGLRAKAISAINLQQPYTSTGVSTLLGGVGGLLTGYAGYNAQRKQSDYFSKRGKL